MPLGIAVKDEYTGHEIGRIILSDDLVRSLKNMTPDQSLDVRFTSDGENMSACINFNDGGTTHVE